MLYLYSIKQPKLNTMKAEIKKINELPFFWIIQESKYQKDKLINAKNATQWHDIESYQLFIKMREELVEVCEKYSILSRLNLKITQQ